jgi:hypothetical protein
MPPSVVPPPPAPHTFIVAAILLFDDIVKVPLVAKVCVTYVAAPDVVAVSIPPVAVICMGFGMYTYLTTTIPEPPAPDPV